VKEVPAEYFNGKFQEFQDKFPGHFSKFLFSKLKKCVKDTKEPHCPLYRVKGTPVVAVVARKDYLLTLDSLLVKFIELEEYELAAECRDLINECQINQVIRESKGGSG